LFHLIQEMSRKGEYFCPNGATRTPKYEWKPFKHYDHHIWQLEWY
jgi:hypothetical protein